MQNEKIKNSDKIFREIQEVEKEGKTVVYFVYGYLSSHIDKISAQKTRETIEAIHKFAKERE